MLTVIIRLSLKHFAADSSIWSCGLYSTLASFDVLLDLRFCPEVLRKSTQRCLRLFL